MIRKADISDDRVVGVGFAVAASVEPKEGNVIDSGYLGWSAFDLQGSAQRTLNVPVAVNNIADALLRAEAFSGCTKNIKAVVLIHGATTLGASFLYNNELVSGAYSKSGRIGHFPVRRSKLVCSCGRSDCLNCEASGWAILNKIGLTDRPEYQHKRVQEYSEKIRALVGGRLEIGKGVKQVDQVLLKAGRSWHLVCDILSWHLILICLYWRGHSQNKNCTLKEQWRVSNPMIPLHQIPIVN